MALPSTKVTAAKRTARPLRPAAPAPNTAKVSEECASSYSLGLDAEELVAQHYQKLGYQLKRRRWRTPFAEVDLLFRRANTKQLILVEVKRCSSIDFRHLVLSKRQRGRLAKAVLWLSEQGWRVEVHLVMVSAQHQIETFREEFSK